MSYTVHVVLQFYRQFDFYTYFVPQEKNFILAPW